jgi:hypothetical protein
MMHTGHNWSIVPICVHSSQKSLHQRCFKNVQQIKYRISQKCALQICSLLGLMSIYCRLKFCFHFFQFNHAELHSLPANMHDIQQYTSSLWKKPNGNAETYYFLHIIIIIIIQMPNKNTSNNDCGS